MYIKNVYIENYKSIKKQSIDFNRGINILVGKNNSGKSNIVASLNEILCEKSYNNQYEEKIFYTDKDGNSSEYFKIVVEIDEVNKNIQFDLIDNIKKSTGVIELENFSSGNNFNDDWFIKDDDYLKENYQNEMETKYKGGRFEWWQPKELKNKLQSTTKVWIYKYVNKQEENINSMIIEVTDIENGSNISVKYYRIFYINANIKSTIITSLIIPAYRDPDNILKITNWSWYGKLLKKNWQQFITDESERDKGSHFNFKREYR